MNLIEKKLETDVYRYLIESGIPSKSTIIVGLSGGPDSTALLVCLSKISWKLKLSLKAAYVNHGIRDRNLLKKEDSFVIELSEKLGVELLFHSIKEGAISEKCKIENRSSEDVAREFRYSFFCSLLKSENTFLALGHNSNDQFETMIARFLQGSGISGLKGIPHKNGAIIRPLIKTSKVDICQYLEEIKQNYCTDHTNNENIYLRNKIRNQLIPEIEKIFPGYTTSLSSLQKRFSEIDGYFDSMSQLAGIQYEKKGCSISLEKFNELHKIIRLNILYKMFDFTYSGGIQSFRVPEGFFNQLVSDNILPDKIFAKAHGIQIYSDCHSLFFAPFHAENSGFYGLIGKDTVIIPGKFIISLKESSAVKLTIPCNSPLICRSRQTGDFIELDDRKKEIKKIFSQWNVREEDKDLIPILEDSQGITAILGEILGYKDIFRNKKINFSEKFNILYLEVRKINPE